MSANLDAQGLIDDCAVIDAIHFLQPTATPTAIQQWLDENRPGPWWRVWGWSPRRVYTCLVRLETLGLISSGWERRAGAVRPRRRLYTVAS